jgi:hypothetical protein
MLQYAQFYILLAAIIGLAYGVYKSDFPFLDTAEEVIGGWACVLTTVSVILGYQVTWEQVLLFMFGAGTVIGWSYFNGVSITKQGLDIKRERSGERDGPVK